MGTRFQWIILIGLFLLVSAINSCIPEPLEVKGLPQLEPKVVVYSQIIPDNGLALLLTRSIGALDASDDSDLNDLINQIALNDASVYVSDGQQNDTLAFIGGGVYGNPFFTFEEGKEYQLFIDSDELGAVSATTTALPQITFDSVNASLAINEFDSLAHVAFSLTDPAGPNYYMVNLQPIEEFVEDGVGEFLNPQIFTYLLVDTAFDGSSYSDEFTVFFQDYSPGDSVLVSLTNISAEYYEFLELRGENRYNFNDFGTEPINYPSNVDDGYGFFLLHQPDFRLFELQE